MDSVSTITQDEYQSLTFRFQSSDFSSMLISRQIEKLIDVISVNLSKQDLNLKPRPRILIHPGTPQPLRIISQQSSLCKHIRISLPAGANLFDALVETLKKIRVSHASITVMGGLFETIYYCVAPPDPFNKAVIAYSEPIIEEQSFLISGNATFGISIATSPLIHCHGILLSKDNQLKGGHIIANQTVIGKYPVIVRVICFENIVVQQMHDTETNLLVLQPNGNSSVEVKNGNLIMEKSNHIEPGVTGRVAFARIAPNEDLVTSIEKLCITEKFRCVFIRTGVGSLVDAHLYNAEGNIMIVNGPAIEIVSLSGEVRQADDGSLNAVCYGVVADTNGNIYGGKFVPGMNIVCITAEVTIEEWLPSL